MTQLSIPGVDRNPEKPVNVASVPQRSPFRYPGGKTWLTPIIRQWLGAKPVPPPLMIEPFAGGGIVSLTAAAENLVEKALMVELDGQVGAVWEVIVTGDADWLAKEIREFDLTLEAVKRLLGTEPRTVRERAFQTIVKNRTFHGGILAAGSAPIKSGENGKGISSRWYPETLSNRLLEIDEYRERLGFVPGDGIEVMQEAAPDKSFVYFIDPPYTAGGKKAGKRLYTHFDLNHEHLFRVAQSLQGDFLMTYDNADEVRALAADSGFDTEPIAMRSTHLAEMTELLISRDLDWVRTGV